MQNSSKIQIFLHSKFKKFRSRYLLLFWFFHAMDVVSPCIANRGVIVNDVLPKHVLIDPSGVLIPVSEFVSIDPDSYEPSWLWIKTPAHTQMNTTAALLNRYSYGVQLFREILRYGVFLPSDAAAVNYIRKHIDTLVSLNNNTLRSIDHDAFNMASHIISEKWRMKLAEWRNAEKSQSRSMRESTI